MGLDDGMASLVLLVLLPDPQGSKNLQSALGWPVLPISEYFHDPVHADVHLHLQEDHSIQ